MQRNRELAKWSHDRANEWGSPSLVVATVQLPQYDNLGCLLCGKLETFEKWLLAEFKGFSRIEVYGEWADSDGKVYVDKSYRYEVACKPIESVTKIRELFNKAVATGREMRQEAIYVSQRGEAQILSCKTEES